MLSGSARCHGAVVSALQSAGFIDLLFLVCELKGHFDFGQLGIDMLSVLGVTLLSRLDVDFCVALFSLYGCGVPLSTRGKLLGFWQLLVAAPVSALRVGSSSLLSHRVATIREATFYTVDRAREAPAADCRVWCLTVTLFCAEAGVPGDLDIALLLFLQELRKCLLLDLIKNARGLGGVFSEEAQIGALFDLLCSIGGVGVREGRP